MHTDTAATTNARLAALGQGGIHPQRNISSLREAAREAAREAFEAAGAAARAEIALAEALAASAKFTRAASKAAFVDAEGRYAGEAPEGASLGEVFYQGGSEVSVV